MNIVEINSKGEFWYKYSSGQRGLRHREGGPAAIFKSGRVEYYRDGKLHNDDGPAIITKSGSKFFFKNSIACSPTKISSHGVHRYLHVEYIVMRYQGPTTFRGKSHRLDGPSIVYPSGRFYYHIYGKPYTHAEYMEEIKRIMKSIEAIL